MEKLVNCHLSCAGKLRRASAHIGRGEHMLALSDVNDVLEVEPQNKQALVRLLLVI